MSRDFRTQQIQVNKVIASGSTGTGAKILFYSIEAEDSGSPNQGIINTSVFDTSNIGNDTFVYFSGGIGTINSDIPGAVVFGGDVYISGNFDVAGAIFDASASQIFNDSTVPGNFVDDALNNLEITKADRSTDLTASIIVNDSTVPGNFVDDALNELSSGLNAKNDFFFSTTEDIIEQSGSLQMSGSGYFKGDLTGSNIVAMSALTSSNMLVNSGITGALNILPDGNPFFVSNDSSITIATASNGQIQVALAENFSSSLINNEIVDYATTTATSSNPESVGQIIFNPNRHFGTIELKAVLANTVTTITTSIKLYNVTSGAYVHLSGASKQLDYAGTTPQIVTSDDLRSATNFSTSEAIYELQVFTNSTSSTATVGAGKLQTQGRVLETSGSEFFFSITEDVVEQSGSLQMSGSGYFKGDLTGSAISISPNTEIIASDVYNFITGTIGAKYTEAQGVTVLAGDLHVSGNITTDSSASYTNFSYKTVHTGSTIIVPPGQQMLYDGVLSIDGDLIIGGEIVQNVDEGDVTNAITNVTNSYTASINETIFADPGTAGFDILLPTAVDNGGEKIEIKNKTTSSNAITIYASGSETIDLSSSKILSSSLAFTIVRSDGNNWWELA